MKKLTALLAVLLTISCTGGCAANEAPIQAAEEISLEESTAQEQSLTETLENAPAEAADSNLPEGMTMDDLRNMVLINGKTLTLPITLDNLTELDERFSYELNNFEYFNNDLERYYLELNGGLMYDIFYDGQQVSQAIMGHLSDFSDLSSKEIRLIRGFSEDMTEAGIDFSLSCGLDLNSSADDVYAVFGEGERKDDSLKYTFTDGTDTCHVHFRFDYENGEYTDRKFSYIAIYFDVPEADIINEIDLDELYLKLSAVTLSYEITDWELEDFSVISCGNSEIKVPCELEDVDTKLLEYRYLSRFSFDEVKEHFDGEFPGDLWLYTEIDGEDENVGVLRGGSGVFGTYMLKIYDIKGLNEKSSKQDVQKILGPGNIEDTAWCDCYGDENYWLKFYYDNDYEYDGKGSHYLVPTGSNSIAFCKLSDEEKAKAADT
ncbi:MAG: hypothetical protein K2N72_08150 [Oscillospiraceae bacterium]|nr:hypothetical protein [Oscillospiraceae bacterium]